MMYRDQWPLEMQEVGQKMWSQLMVNMLLAEHCGAAQHKACKFAGSHAKLQSDDGACVAYLATQQHQEWLFSCLIAT